MQISDSSSDSSDEQDSPLAAEVASHYATGYEAQRLTTLAGTGRLELVRTQELVQRYAPSSPAIILDVGGGPGAYARWLAGLGYEVHLVDALPLHVELAQRADQEQSDAHVATITLGDARRLERPDASADLVLLLGPLYHLTEQADRIAALAEARRVVRPGGRVLAAVISRFATALDSMVKDFLDDPDFLAIIQRDLADGQHRNPTQHPGYFTTAYLHHPTELRAEMEAAGLRHEATLAIEGPAWLVQRVTERWEDATYRERVLEVLRLIEQEPTLLGASAHLLGVASRPNA